MTEEAPPKPPRTWKINGDQLTSLQIKNRQAMVNQIMQYNTRKKGCCGEGNQLHVKLVSMNYATLEAAYMELFGKSV